LMVCSSSAGPAFEGGNLRSGMLARPGAIDSVRISDGKVSYTVIGGVEPKGICGSGIIDLLAQLYLDGLIDKRGNFTDRAELKDGRFILYGDIGISVPEIRDVMMTKAAIFSASRALVRNLGIGFSDLEHIYIAGGFGNFIDMDSAIQIGMFPDVPRDRFVYLGNASLAGAKAALLSSTFRDRIDEAFGKMTYLDLSSDPVFFDEYMSAQFIPHTESDLFPTVRPRVRD
ncbi:MAG: ATP-binding protein, partial [Candidatus Methanomethylophilaceae archaeon]|nr:ATP-binding protein [Candidatus Methanomethylophilaceae archaeon]